MTLHITSQPRLDLLSHLLRQDINTRRFYVDLPCWSYAEHHDTRIVIMILQEVPPSTPSMGALSSTIKKRRTTDADWERYQSKIVRLYIDEKRSREDVISIMKSEDGLDIT